MHTVSLFSHCQQLYCVKVSNKSFTFNLCLKTKMKREVAFKVSAVFFLDVFIEF